MTRQDELDRRVIDNMRGLEFLVLDELHTYRGRQGADVAMLVRRVRQRTDDGRLLLCIGTSATMASGKEDAGRKAVSEVGTILFGSPVEPDDVITESLDRCTEWTGSTQAFAADLRSAVEDPDACAGDWKHDPLAVWIELNIGLEAGEKLTRARPRTLNDAARDLARDTGCSLASCEIALKHRLSAMSAHIDGNGSAFMAFKLHRFLSGAGHAHATIEPGELPPWHRILELQKSISLPSTWRKVPGSSETGPFSMARMMVTWRCSTPRSITSPPMQNWSLWALRQA